MAVVLHSPADLHLYDAQGRHVGKNYDTGEIDLEIPGSSYSSEDPQTITVTEPVAGNYTVQMIGTEGGDYELEIIGTQDEEMVSSDSYTGTIASGAAQASYLNVTAMEGALTIFSSEPEAAPVLDVSPTRLMMIGYLGETSQGSFVISETQGDQAVQDISFFASDLIGDPGGVITGNGVEFVPSTVISLPAGTSQTISVTIPLGDDLPGGTYTYYGTITVESINAGAKSIDVSVALGGYTIYLPLILKNYPPDTTPPAAVPNLSTSNPTLHSMTLNWTAPGDDCNTGTASEYDIRYSTSPITDANWDAAARCVGEPAPQPAGSSETFTVNGLNPNTTYYFALT